MQDDEVLRALVAGTLDPGSFRHRDHVAAGLAALKSGEFFSAAEVFARGLRHLTATAGVPQKYNATMTLAFMSLIAEAHVADPALDADGLIARHPALTDMAALGMRYSEGRLRGDVARRVALLPDREGSLARA